MYIVHFMKYEDEILTDAWTSDDYFKTHEQAEKWLLTLGGRGGKFVQDDTFKNNYIYKEDDIRIDIRTEAEIKYIYEFLGL